MSFGDVDSCANRRALRCAQCLSDLLLSGSENQKQSDASAASL